MTVKELITKLKEFPLDAEIQKVNLKDKAGISDTKMTLQDWGLARNIKDAEKKPLDKKLVFCIFNY